MSKEIENKNKSVSCNNGVFTKEELDKFKSHVEGVISYKKDGTPFINYLKAKEVFEDVVGQDYSIKIISSNFYPEYNTLYIHVRFSVERNGCSFEKDVMTGAKGMSRDGSSDIFNFEDLAKSAMKDAMKKFFSDYMGIGAEDFKIAKEKALSKSNKYSPVNGAGESNGYSCSACSVGITALEYNFSTMHFPAKRPLCRKCQDKFKKGELNN